jgi:hypothetical protein
MVFDVCQANDFGKFHELVTFSFMEKFMEFPIMAMKHIGRT